MRKIVAASVVLLASFAVVSAEEFGAVITKVEGNKVTLTKRQKGQKEGEEVTLTAADNVKVVKGKFNRETKKFEAGDPIEAGLKSELLTKKGSFARVTTDDQNRITEIRVGEGFRKGKRKKDA